MSLMTAKEAAEKWEITHRRVQEIIREGRIEGVYKIGNVQVVPDDTQKPSDLRKERYKKKDKESN